MIYFTGGAMNNDIFGGPRLKIKRADKHIEEAKEIVNQYIGGGSCNVVFKKDPNRSGFVIEASHTKELPCDLPLVIGDAIHNLRASLDILLFSLLLPAGTKSKHVKFPFRNTRDELIAAINGGDIKAIGKDIIDVIVDSIRPYRDGGEASLCALHEIDIDDKHLLIIPVAGISSVTLDVTDRGGTMRGNTISFGGNKMNVI